MTELEKIKERIHNEERIEELLEELGCWNIDTEQNGNLYVAGLPDGDNERSVQIKNKPSLTSHIRSKGVSGDIYAVVSFILYEADTEEKQLSTLSKSKFWICNKLGYLEYIDEFYKVTSSNEPQIPQYNKWLKQFKEKESVALSNTVIRESVLERYGIIPYLGWINEGLSVKTQRYFGVGIDVPTERVTFPVHNKEGGLIGVKGRYIGTDEHIQNHYKYLYIVPCNKSIEFFNFHRAVPYIKEKKEVIVVEGAKTVMLLHQWGYRNVISVEGDSITDQQFDLLKELGLDIKYIFAWDQDKSVEYVFNEVSRLKGRMRFAIYDKDNLLSAKDSPCDKGKEVWENLLNNYCYKIT